MDGYAYNENDYRIQGILRKNNITDEDVENWFQRKAKVKDVVLSVSLSVWRKSLDPRFPSSRVDAVIFAHNKNHSIALEIQNHFQKILFQLEPKIEIFSKESWTPVDNGSMHFKTNDGKVVSASLGFLVVTPEFCTEEWGTLSGQPFFQQAMYDKDVTIVPVLVNNTRHMKERIPLGIKCLRSVDFYNKDDIISQKTLDTFLKPAIKSRVNKEKEELRYHIYWLYWNAIKVYHHYPWSYPQHKRSRMPSQDDSDYFKHSTYQSYSQQSSSPNGKGDQTTGQGFSRNSAYGSDERNSQWAESTGSAPCGDGDRASHHSNQSADDMYDLPYAPSLDPHSLIESMSTVKSHKHKTHSPLHRDIGEQRSSNGTSSSQDETDVKRHFPHH